MTARTALSTLPLSPSSAVKARTAWMAGRDVQASLHTAGTVSMSRKGAKSSPRATVQHASRQNLSCSSKNW